MRRPEGLLFDLGNTLLGEVRFDAAAGQARLLALAIHVPPRVTAAEVQVRARQIDAAMRSRREDSLLEFRATAVTRLLYDRLGVEFGHAEAELELEFWRAAVQMRTEPNVVDALEAARRDIPMGIVSNSGFSGRVLEDELARHGLEGRFRFVMASADYGFRKPHPLLFETAAARLGRRPEAVWFVGDSLRHDIAGARGVGMTAIWYNPTGYTAEAIHPDAEIRDWAELPALLR